uniref:Uncharacterized protein n=1 Tax=Anguilla anguilla TaxID=7936 RepID=A0A0E9R8Z1_ANGAN
MHVKDNRANLNTAQIHRCVWVYILSIVQPMLIHMP